MGIGKTSGSCGRSTSRPNGVIAIIVVSFRRGPLPCPGRLAHVAHTPPGTHRKPKRHPCEGNDHFTVVCLLMYIAKHFVALGEHITP
jgi:hypothetical protein